MINLYITIAVILSFLVETVRIKAEHGKVVNINHNWSVAIAVALFIPIPFILQLWHWQAVVLILSCIGCRGTLYDPGLNMCLGRYLDGESDTSNSKIDAKEKERKINFWMQRLLYLLLWVVSYFLYFISLKIWPL